MPRKMMEQKIKGQKNEYNESRKKEKKKRLKIWKKAWNNNSDESVLFHKRTNGASIELR